jgi:DNA-binding transcriptional ArsR family regulator
MEASIRALAEPRRRRILELVRDEELTAGEIASAFEISRPAVSQHLTVLRDAGLLELRREGTKRLYRARAEGLTDVREFIESFWDGRLERLRLAAEHEEGRRRSGSSAA